MRLLAALVIVLIANSSGVCAPRSDAGKPVTGEGVIDRVLTSGSEPVFRAAGYTFRIVPATDLRFEKGLQSLSEVGTNTWATFQGNPDDSGTIVATKATFVRLKFPKYKPDAKAVQATTIPPGSKIDGSDGLGTDPKLYLPQDHCGPCGWFYISNRPIEQEHVRVLGQKLIPQYQRDLPDDDPAKIHFRFYVIEEIDVSPEIFCDKGLVLIPVEDFRRITNESQLAAILADDIAGVIQQQAVAARGITWKEAEQMAPGLLAFGGTVPAIVGSAGEMTLQHKLNREVEHQLGRMALSYLADAGFDLRQAPEIWRWLAPKRLPKDPTKLKYPERSLYLETILKTQYKTASGGPA